MKAKTEHRRAQAKQHQAHKSRIAILNAKRKPKSALEKHEKSGKKKNRKKDKSEE